MTFDPCVLGPRALNIVRDGAPKRRIESVGVEGGIMRANVGDRVVIKGHHVGDPDRDAEVLEVKGENGAPPWVVRWSDDGHEGLFFPGSDAVVEHIEKRPSKT